MDLGLLMGRPYKPSVPLRANKTKNPPHAPVPGKHSKKGEPFARPSVYLGVLGGKIPLCPLCLCGALLFPPMRIQKRAKNLHGKVSPYAFVR